MSYHDVITVQVSSSKGSDGHTLAVTTTGELYLWGDGDYGKLGHGNSTTHKTPKQVLGVLNDKVCVSVYESHDCGCLYYLFVVF